MNLRARGDDVLRHVALGDLRAKHFGGDGRALCFHDAPDDAPTTAESKRLENRSQFQKAGGRFLKYDATEPPSACSPSVSPEPRRLSSYSRLSLARRLRPPGSVFDRAPQARRHR